MPDMPQIERSHSIRPRSAYDAKARDATMPMDESMPMYGAMPDASGALPAAHVPHSHLIHTNRRGLLLQVAAAVLGGACGQVAASVSARNMPASGDAARNASAHGATHRDPCGHDGLVLRAGWLLRATDC